MKPERPRRVWFPDMNQRQNCQYYDHGACNWHRRQRTLNEEDPVKHQYCRDVHYCDVGLRYRKGPNT